MAPAARLRRVVRVVRVVRTIAHRITHGITRRMADFSTRFLFFAWL